MNYIDLIILLVFAWAAFRGFTKGLVVMVAAFIALIIGLWGAVKYSGIVAGWLVDTMNVSSPYMQLVSFTVTFLGIVIAINVAAFLLSRLLDAIALGFVNRLLGVFFGILKMALLLSVLFLVLNSINVRYEFLPEDDVDNSMLYKPVAKLAPGIFPFLQFDTISKEIEKLVGDSIDQTNHI
ncbi:MAG: CvpA family protein [Bacteroidales bacterium]